jgi:hypothetical protein
MATLKGGDKLEAALREISRKVSKPGKLRVGFLEDTTYPNGTSVAMVAAIQEFGAPKANIPPRPFFRNMIAGKSDEWAPAIGNLLPQNNYDVRATLEIIGDGIKGQLQQSIIDTTQPPLSPVTLMLRKMFGNSPERITGKAVGEAARRVAAGESYGGVSTKPLDWTGHMKNSVGSEVT